MAVRFGLLITVLLAGALFFVSKAAGQGMLMGGIAGIVAFWITAVRVEKLAQRAPGSVNVMPMGLAMFRVGLYIVALWRAYMLDSESMHGLLAAAGGLFVIRGVLAFLGLTGLDLKESGSEVDGKDR